MAVLKVLMVDAATGFYKIERYPIGEKFFGPVDLGLYLAGRYRSINIGAGLLAGSIFPGANRLIFSGFSPCWSGFYVSSMGGAALVFNNLGVDLLAVIKSAPQPSLLYLNRSGGEDIDVALTPVHLEQVWNGGRGGVFSLMDHIFERFADRYPNDPRILAVGPAAAAADCGAVVSVPVERGRLTHVDTWAGRGGFGSKLLQEHGVAGIIYGGTPIEEDFRDRKVADQWFVDKYQKKLAAKDLEATTKYRFDPKFETGGTFGVNFATLGGRMMSFNYRSIYMQESERCDLHDRFVLQHYLKQFNEETIRPKRQKTCGEPCAAVCKKMRGEYKKDYEPYQAMGPLTGIFDQRAAEKLNQHANRLGFDAISIGGVLAWLMECLDTQVLRPKDCGATQMPVFSLNGFQLESDSMHNADLCIELLDSMLDRRGPLNLADGARKLAHRLSRQKGRSVLDPFVYNAFARKGWMVPNQYWTPGALSPMAIMGKYYMYYGDDFLPPRELGRRNARRMQQELVMDNMGMCRFHRGWAEEMLPEIVGSLFGLKDAFVKGVHTTASRINSRNSSVFWESQRSIDWVKTFLQRKHTVDGSTDRELLKWIDFFQQDPHEAALGFWYDIHKGIQESLKAF